MSAFARMGKIKRESNAACEALRPRPRILANGALEDWILGVLRRLRIVPRDSGVGVAFRAHLFATDNSVTPETRGSALKGQKSSAQGFNPGLGFLEERALKGHQTAIGGWTLQDKFMHAEQILSGAAFRAHLLATRNPGLKPWAKFFCPFRAGTTPGFRPLGTLLRHS